MAKNEVLAATATLMTSENYKDRFKAEYIQLKNRDILEVRAKIEGINLE